MTGPTDDSPAMHRAAWLRALYSDPSAPLDDGDVTSCTTAALRSATGWQDAAGFRAGLLAEELAISGLRPDGDAAVLEATTPGGVRLERVVRVDDDGRLDRLVTRLAGGASMTMVSAAAWRASHAAYDDPIVLDDQFAAQFVGDASPYQAEAVRAGTHGTDGRHYRWNMAARARLAEDTMADLHASAGTRQYVVLGAGLDTYAMRKPFDDVTVYEVDTPESQAWKLARMEQIGLAAPAGVRYVSCNFEHQDFADQLADAGFDPTLPAVAAWLGVSYYLTGEAIEATLERVGSWPPGSAIVFDYMLAEHRWDEFDDFDADGMRAVLAAVAAAGEPFLSQFDDGELTELLHAHGFDRVDLLGADDIVARYMPGRTSPIPGPDPALKLACARITGR